MSDVDSGENVFVAETKTGIYGSLTIDATGNWSYEANNIQAAIQNLAADSMLTDTIDGLAGNGPIIGETGVYTLTRDADNWGADIISDIDSTNELLDLVATGLTFASLAISQTGAGTLIEGGSSNSIVLPGITVTDIDQHDFSF